MIRRFISFICITSLILPSVAFATDASPVTLKNVLEIMQKSSSPVQYHMDLQSSFPGFRGSLSIEGRASGNHHSLKDVSTDMDVVFDLSLDEQGTISINGKLRVVGGTAYVYIDSWDATAQLNDMKTMLDPFLKKWISFPLDPSQYDLTQDMKVAQSTEAFKRFENFFEISRTVSGGSAHYTVALPVRKKRSFLMALMGVTRAFASPRTNALIRRSARSTTIDISFILNAFTSGVFTDAKGTIDLKLPYNGKPFTFSYNASTHITSAFARINAPQDSVAFQDLLRLPRIDAKSISDARNAQRRADLNTLLNAVYQYWIDNNGKLPSTLVKGKQVMICQSTMTCAGISLDVFINNYIVKVPVDPQQDSSSSESGYTIEVLSDGKIRVSAPKAENQQSISVTR